LASKAIEFGDKTQNKGYYAVQGHSKSFKVIEIGINGKPVCDFLLVNNTNTDILSHTVSQLAYPQLIFKFWTLRF